MSRAGAIGAARLALLYTAFAVIATLCNLAAQRVALAGGDGPARYMAAVAAGTLAGLVVKYLLDKRWIFADRSTGLRAHGRRFTLYTAMGLVTTAIFWGTETAFWLVWDAEAMRELGAVIGLAVGYAIKYRLDKRFVFSGMAAP